MGGGVRTWVAGTKVELPGVWGVTPSALRAGIREGYCHNLCQWEEEGRGSASLFSK